MRGVAARQDQTAPEPLHMEQQIDFPGRLDATQLEGCWINVCGCCQGFRPTGPDTFVSSCSPMFGVILCCNSGERYKRVPGTNNFLHEEETYYSDTKHERVQGPAGAFGADLIARFHSKYIMFEKNGMEWMCCNGLHCNVPCSIPEAISKDKRAGIPWNKFAGVTKTSKTTPA